MGEKIRDINTIKIGKTELMIELNEGYSNEGQVIHVQNRKFRYLFKEKQFYKLCSNILRAKSELDYLRMHRIANQKFDNQEMLDNNINSTIEDIKTYFEYLNQRKIDYRIVEIYNKFATVIISPCMHDEFTSACASNENIVMLKHPYGKLFGYKFLYQMMEIELYLYRENYIQVFYQLPCMSLENNTWIPLDRAIQKRIWECDQDCYLHHEIDNETKFIYEICLCIFQFRSFTKRQVEILSALFDESDKEILETLLKLVFFSFTDILLTLLEEKKYTEIINCYFTYSKY